MDRKLRFIILAIACIMLVPMTMQAQMPGDLSNRYIRVAEIGELADSVNVWGDVSSSGRFIIPINTNLPDLISFAFGYGELQTRGPDINWSKTRILVKVSRYNQNRKLVNVALFKYKFEDPEPVQMFEFDLQNNDIVTVQVKRVPSFPDYVDVIAPVIGVVATSVLLLENLRQ